METVKIRCKTLCVGDWVANRNGSPMQIVAVDEDNAYACEGNDAYACEGNNAYACEGNDAYACEGNDAYACEGNDAYACEGNEERPWIFGDDEGYEPEPIELTPEILEKNGWWYYMDDLWQHEEVGFYIEKLNGRFQCYDINDIKLDSVHKLQQTLRLCGLNELADNFKI